MGLLTPALRAALRANATSARLPGYDPAPVLKLFNPVGPATWLATELDDDGDVLFGLADLGFGCPELGYFSLSELARVRLPFGLAIERDIGFASDFPLSRWAHAASVTGSILRAEAILRRENPAPDPELSSDFTDG
ncbi:DUF2958 domain-containing protein [Sphingomonas glacialis]|uniref:DUF2958 domain-containing protein n=1 Tax=Sphingomonas glacialis TaxID=658225 RepID=A0A502FF72_9SPHN|nr:DUF2958 domain-containing protein [Sphingomonas glacialis]TPG48077.1 DUF2958 domain-containing protein [Sphingomonas glacialis]